MCRYALEASALKQGQSEDKLHNLLRQLPKVRESACAWTNETPLLRTYVSYWNVFIHTHTHLQDLPTLRDSWLQIKESFTLAQQYTEVRIIWCLAFYYWSTSTKVLTYLLTSTKVVAYSWELRADLSRWFDLIWFFLDSNCLEPR